MTARGNNDFSDKPVRFLVGRGRYESLVNTRYKNHTYGTQSFTVAKEDSEEVQAHGTYGALLFDKRWIKRRAEILLRDQHKCVICFDDERLQVHHRQYHFIKALQQFKSPWDYEDYILITLCERCHSRGHSKYTIPNIYL